MSREQAGAPLVRFVSAAFHLPLDDAERAVRDGGVYVTGRRKLDGGLRVLEGQVVTMVTEAQRVGEQTARPQGPLSSLPALSVLYEDEDVLLVAKAAGVVSQPTPGRVGTSLLDAVRARNPRAGLVHRLDRETSGVMVFGQHDVATRALAAAFRVGDARKRYLAITGPMTLERSDMRLPISPDPTRKGRFRASPTANGRPARTLLSRLSGSDDLAVLVLFPLTGRTHQLRAHLRALGSPIAGDALYGGPAHLRGRSISRCLLHAHALSIPHPSKRAPLVTVAEPPEDMQAFLPDPLPTLGFQSDEL